MKLFIHHSYASVTITKHCAATAIIRHVRDSFTKPERIPWTAVR